jgi:putative Mn2+ efflux pump MntP
MIGDLVAFGLVAGSDNLQTCSALGLLPLRRRRLHLLAAAFSLSEIGAAAAGLALGHALHGSLSAIAAWVPPLVLLACGVLALVRLLGGSDVAPLANRGVFLFGMPLSLGLDNLATGAGIGAADYPLVPAVLAVGAISAAMSCIGLYFGAWLRGRRLLPARAALLPAIWLCAAGLRMTFWEHA